MTAENTSQYRASSRVNTPEQVREKLHKHAANYRLENYRAFKETAWEVIHDMENAWRDRPVKIRVANRRSVLAYLFGVDSTKKLDDGQLGALLKWMRHSPDREAELRLVLRAALVEAGQAEMTLETGEQDLLDAAKTLQELAQEDFDARRALVATQTEQDNLRREQLRLLVELDEA